MSRASFNLVDRPWITVEGGSGDPREVGLAELFAKAHEIRRIVSPSPIISAALHRMVFAVFHRAVPVVDDEEWTEAWETLDYRPATAAYLGQWHPRFDIFDAEAPFWQVTGMEESCKTAWTKLAIERPPNSSKLLFDHTATIDPPPASPAELARALISSQMFTVGAGKSCTGYTAHAPLASALVVIPQGRNLAETLMANLTVGSASGDLPVWEAPPLTRDQIEHQASPIWSGPASRLTWTSRAVRLDPSDDGSTKWVSFGMGLRHAPADGDRDPWVSYRVSKEGIRLARKLDPDRMAWRDFHGMLAGQQDGAGDSVHALTRLVLLTDTGRPAPESWDLLVAGLAADRANVNAWRQEVWRLPRTVIGNGERIHAVQEAIEIAEDAGRSVRAAAWAVAHEMLARSGNTDKKEVSSMSDAMPTASTYWSSLESEFQRFLDGLGTDVDKARAEWLIGVATGVRAAAKATHASLGRDARALRAWAKSSTRFDTLVAELNAKSKAISSRDGEVVQA